MVKDGGHDLYLYLGTCGGSFVTPAWTPNLGYGPYVVVTILVMS